ncbi:MAG: ATP-binding cassette domain-containing protein [Acidobacteria bacterium]|nr:MAG: ATP-binding cassette domain-containing protein [Acidobacteriota bacterium]
MTGGGAIRVERVSFGYPGRARVLDEVTVDVAPGTILALVGPSGAGKSTILKLINRMLVPTAGRVLVEGRDTRDWPELRLRRQIGYVIQDVGLFPHLSVAANVGLVPTLEGWPRERTGTRVRELMALVGLPFDEFAERAPDELSGGQRQRVGVARALAADPPFLLMDEPFGALDPATRADLRREFAEIQATLRKTVVIVTHDMAEAFALGTTVGVLHGGSLIACGPPAAIRASDDPRVRKFL